MLFEAGSVKTNAVVEQRHTAATFVALTALLRAPVNPLTYAAHTLCIELKLHHLQSLALSPPGIAWPDPGLHAEQPQTTAQVHLCALLQPGDNRVVDSPVVVMLYCRDGNGSRNTPQTLQTHLYDFVLQSYLFQGLLLLFCQLRYSSCYKAVCSLYVHFSSSL